MTTLDKLTTILARHMGKEPSDPDVLEAVVEVVMAMREPSEVMIRVGGQFCRSANEHPANGEYNAVDAYQAMIDALLTEGDHG